MINQGCEIKEQKENENKVSNSSSLLSAPQMSNEEQLSFTKKDVETEQQLVNSTNTPQPLQDHTVNALCDSRTANSTLR